MNLDIANIEYFKKESARTGVPYQTLINLYLTECRQQERHLTFG
jgi:predicted DNA binding CopG/RHH family protein